MKANAKSIVEYRVYELPLDIPVLFLHGDQWRISDALSNRLHFHNCIEIGFCHSDGGTLFFEGKSFAFAAGDITIIPRHLPHTTCSTKGTKSLWSYFFIDMNALLRDMLPIDRSLDLETAEATPQTFLFGAAQHSRIHFLAHALREEYMDRKADWLPMFQSLSLSLYYELVRLWHEEAPPKSEHSIQSFVLKPVLEYIRQHYMEPTSVKKLADICHLSETHFRRVFLSIMGTSPLHFINVTRISQACILLDTTEFSILSVAEAVGINSISSFNRNFSGIMGISPREYRHGHAKASLTPKQKYILPYKGWLAAEERPEHVIAEPPASARAVKNERSKKE